jgi:hypothetical protein
VLSPCVLIQIISKMQLTAKLVELLPLQTGTSSKGEWRKQNIVVETEDQYPKKICISVWGDKIDANQLQPGNKLKIDFDIESREYNQRWYTDVKAWKIELANATTQGEPIPPIDPTFDPGPAATPDDMPF